MGLPRTLTGTCSKCGLQFSYRSRRVDRDMILRREIWQHEKTCTGKTAAKGAPQNAGHG